MVQAVVLSDFGSPDVLVRREIEVAEPGAGQIQIDVRFAGVGPTDLAIRAGRLGGAFGAAPGSVLGFEVAGVVSAVGAGVHDVARGDAVAAFLPELGGYAGQVLARYWVRRPDGVSEEDAAALPASGEAAVRVLDETRVAAGETVLIVGAGGSVGLIAAQLALHRRATVVGAVPAGDIDVVGALGVTAVVSGPELATAVRAVVPTVDAVIDASGAGVLAAAVELAGGPDRVVTLSDHRASDFGVRLSSPDGPRIADRLGTAMAALARGDLRLRARTTFPLAAAASVHQALESRALRTKALLATEA